VKIKYVVKFFVLLIIQPLPQKLFFPTPKKSIHIGGTFNAEVSNVERTISSNIRPFRLAFHTDSVEAPNDVDNRGFCLDYIQQPCTNG